jgi:hypothetical protein
MIYSLISSTEENPEKTTKKPEDLRQQYRMRRKKHGKFINSSDDCKIHNTIRKSKNLYTCVIDTALLKEVRRSTNYLLYPLH